MYKEFVDVILRWMYGVTMKVRFFFSIFEQLVVTLIKYKMRNNHLLMVLTCSKKTYRSLG